jgi:hypothetical protein
MTVFVYVNTGKQVVPRQNQFQPGGLQLLLQHPGRPPTQLAARPSRPSNPRIPTHAADQLRYQAKKWDIYWDSETEPTMKFTPQSHMKAATILLLKARAATGKRKLRLEGLAYAHQIRAKQLELRTTGITVAAAKQAAPSDPTDPDGQQGRLETLDAWEQHLADLLSRPDSVSRTLSVEWTKAVIAAIRTVDT